MNQENHSLLKALDILNQFSKENQEMRISDIAEKLCLPISTAHRILKTLELKQYISQNPLNGKYRLGVSAFILGTNVVSINKLVDAALPRIAALANKYQAISHVAIEQSGYILCVEKVISPFVNTPTPRRGGRHILQITSVGKCILAFSPPQVQNALLKRIEFVKATPYSIITLDALMEELRQVRKQGYAIDNQESVIGLFCFGAPIFINDVMLAAISVSLNCSNMPQNAASIITDVMDAGKQIQEHIRISV